LNTLEPTTVLLAIEDLSRLGYLDDSGVLRHLPPRMRKPEEQLA